jgi:hypothetical protein
MIASSAKGSREEESAAGGSIFPALLAKLFRTKAEEMVAFFLASRKCTIAISVIGLTATPSN